MITPHSGELDFLHGAPETIEPGTNAFIDKWGTNDSNFTDYCEYAPLGTREIIESRLAGLASKAAIDIAGGTNGMAIQQLLRDGLIDTGLVTNYRDLRDDALEEMRMDHVDGDILRKETWLRILEWQRERAPDGFSLVLHRPVGGLQKLEPKIYKGALNLLLSRTRPSGALLTQIPDKLDHTEQGERLCSELAARTDIEAVYAPKYFQVRPMALILKSAQA